MTLQNPNQPATCDDRTKQDFETLMADQFSGDVYLVQKNNLTADVSLYKVGSTFEYFLILARNIIIYGI